nr:hypothetical protein [Amycolatopsis australiensis]
MRVDAGGLAQGTHVGEAMRLRNVALVEENLLGGGDARHFGTGDPAGAEAVRGVGEGRTPVVGGLARGTVSGEDERVEVEFRGAVGEDDRTGRRSGVSR